MKKMNLSHISLFPSFEKTKNECYIQYNNSFFTILSKEQVKKLVIKNMTDDIVKYIRMFNLPENDTESFYDIFTREILESPPQVYQT